MQQTHSNNGNINARVLRTQTILNNQYRIEKVIGEGGFGITYLGVDLYLKVKVAIKEYFPTQFATRNVLSGNNGIIVISGKSDDIYKKGVQDFALEANKLSRLKDLSGIVSVLNFFYENNTAYMVMEYVEGISIKAYMKQRGAVIPCEEVIEIMHQAINALEVVHREGIIHRDISPDNIMISPDESKVTIIDFGAARMFEEDKSKTIMVKQGYAPPEQYFKNGNQGPWTDVYALCATIFFMISAVKLPDAMARMNKKGSQEIVDRVLATIPQKEAEVLKKGLEPKIENRIKSMEELERCLYGNVKLRNRKNVNIKALIGSVAGSAALIAIAFVVVWAVKGKMNTESNSAKPENEPVYADESSAEYSAGETEVENEEVLDETEEAVDETEEVVVENIPSDYAELEEIQPQYITTSVTENGLVVDSVNSKIIKGAIPQIIDGQSVVSIKSVNSNIVTICIPGGVREIQDYCFRNCVYLEKIYISDTVEYIGPDAFKNCVSITDIVVSPNNKNYYVSENVLYSSDGQVILEW